MNEIIKKYDGDLALHLRDVVSVEKDLLETKSFLEYLLTTFPDNDTFLPYHSALWNASLISFFKCFSTGVRKYSIKKEIFCDLKREKINFYNHLKEIRDKHIAHSVSSLDEVMVGVMLHPRTHKFLGITDMSIRHVMMPKEGVESFLSLVNLAVKHVEQDYQKAQTDLENEISSISPEIMKAWEDFEYEVPEPEKAARKARKQNI